MSYSLPYPKFRAFSPTTNLPLVGGKLYSYIINTTTPKSLYADAALTTPLANPVILDSNGEATIFGTGLYDLKLTTSADVLVWTADDVSFDATATVTLNTTVEWIVSTAATYIAANQFTVAGDQTGTFLVNRRVKCVRTATTVYGTITASVYTTSTLVTVLLDSGTLDTDLQTVSVGLLSPINDSIPRTIPQKALNNIFTGTNTFNAAVTVVGTFTVTGNQTVSGTLGVTGGVTLSATLSVGTNLSVTGTSTLTGNTTVGGTLGVTGALTASAAVTANSIGVNVAAPTAGKLETSSDINAGGLVYAPNGFKQPGSGGETLKIIRGVVDSSGAVIEGSGFTAVRNSTGNFTITFSTAFSNEPAFFGTPVAATGNRSITIISYSTTAVNYECRANNDNALANNDHHIIVVGPK